MILNNNDTHYKGTYRVNLEEAFYIMLCDVRADEFDSKTLNETDKYVLQLSISARLNTKNVGDS